MTKDDKYISIANSLISADKEDEYYKTWNIIEDMKDIEQFDTDQAWGKMMNRFEEKQLVPETDNNESKTRKFRWSTIAASIVLGIISGMLWNNYMDTTSYVANNTAEVMEYEMPDKSVIYLKPNAEISWEKGFSDQHRNLLLAGEAFFDVERNENVPFKVYAEGALVTVLGTSFNVRVIEETKKVEVFVKTGKVSLSGNSSENNSLALIPNEMGVFNKGVIDKTIPETSNYMSWMDKKLIFKNAGLSSVVNDLSRAYGIEIQLSDSDLDSLNITATYEDLNAGELIQSLCLTLDLQCNKKDKSYILVSQ